MAHKYTKQLGVNISAWFDNQFPEAALNEVISHPWAKTWKVSDNDQVYFLKQIKRDGTNKVICADVIAKTFKQTVPRVITSNPDLSVIAIADHKGTAFRSRTKNMESVLRTYAQLQVDAINNKDTLSCIPQVDLDNFYHKFLKFLQADKIDESNITAAHFIGVRRARALRVVFSELSPLFTSLLEQASNLPLSLNHCDLRPQNMARRTDGSITIFDWDDAKWGPIGMSLHAQFSGCLRPYLALSSEASATMNKQTQSDQKHLNSYIRIFEANYIADPESLRRNLPSAVVIGTLSYILDFENYSKSSTKTRRAIARNIIKRLSSVLDVVDLLTSKNGFDRKKLANIYFKNSMHNRLQNLQKICKEQLLDIPQLNSQALRNSRKPDVFPSLLFSEIEMKHEICTDENAKLAAKIYKEQGAVLLENSLSKELISACRRYVFEKYKTTFENGQPSDSLRVGKKRFMMTLPLEGPFNQPELYANPIIMRIMKRILGDNFILGSMVVVTSLPGSKIQSRHRDHHALFREEELVLPPFAVSVMIPLIDMNEEVGVTRVFKGTHLQSTDIASKMPGQDPVVTLGSCFLMDYRVQHRGMPNLTKDTVRPVVTMIIQRPWFRDYDNYNHQERMILKEEELKKVPSEYRPLFDWK
jgi:hypothetical protein